MLGRPHTDAHRLFWMARRDAAYNARDGYQLADLLKETPHKKDEEREVREAIQALEEMRSKLKDEENETVAEERPLVFSVDHLNSDERDIYDAIPNESIKKKYLRILQRERAETQGRRVAEPIFQAELRVTEPMERLKLRVVEQETLMIELKLRVATDLAKIVDLATNAEWCLLAMSALSQAEGTVAENTKQADSMAAEKM